MRLSKLSLFSGQGVWHPAASTKHQLWAVLAQRPLLHHSGTGRVGTFWGHAVSAAFGCCMF